MIQELHHGHGYGPLPVTAPRRLWQLPTFVLGLVAVWAAATGVTPPPDAIARYTGRLDDLAAALDRKPPDAGEVEPLVRLLADAPNQSPRSHYLLGSAYVMLAGLKPTESSDLWKLALLHFDACDAGAMTPTEMALLTFRSAVAKAAVGSGDPAVLIAAMMNAPPGEDRSECPRLIAECALRLPQPDLPRARDELTSYLGGPNRAAPVMADRYRLTLADLNRKLNDPERAKLWLKAISAAAPADVLVPAKLALAQQAVAERNWAEAVALYEAAQAIPGIPAGEKGAIRYQIANALVKIGNGMQAAAYYEQASREPGAIGAQASLRLAEMRALDPTGRGKRGEAVDWLERAVVMLPAEAITENERKSAESLVRVCLAEEDFANAVRAADAYSRISPKNADLQLRADINQHWGMALQKAGDPGAKVKFRVAADCSLALAETLIADPDKAAVLKQAAYLQRQAGDGTAALQTINRLLKTAALDAAAKAALHVQRSELLPPTDFAGIRESLEIAMGQPGPAANAARLKLALLHVNRSQDLVVTIQGSLNPDAVRKEAEQTGQFGRDLLAQVADMANVPAESRSVHEQSLFELGRLNLRDSKFTDAESRFKKQLSLYPNGPYAGYGRLWLVCSLLQQARGNEFAKKRLLEDALAYLKPLTQSTDPYLRTYGEIWTTNTLLELGDAAAVVPMAKNLMTKYQGKPEELVAGKLLFYAYLKIATPEPAEASRTLDRMEAAFAALPKTAYPNDPEYSHERWKAELPRLREDLRKFSP